jgi:hypothetical protein
MNKNYSRIPCFVEMKSKQQIKFVVFQLQNTYNSSHSSPKSVFKNNPCLPPILPLWAIPNHIIMIQNQQKFKIQNYNDPRTVPILNALFIQIM